MKTEIEETALPPDNRAAECRPPAHGSPPVFRWEQCYEMGGIHWALCDTATDEECEREGGPHRVSCAYMVLAADYDRCMDGRTINEQFLPALIVRLLNEHYAREANDQTQQLGGGK